MREKTADGGGAELTLFQSQRRQQRRSRSFHKDALFLLLIPELYRTNGLSDFCNKASLPRSPSVHCSFRSLQDDPIMYIAEGKEKARILFPRSDSPKGAILGRRGVAH